MSAAGEGASRSAPAPAYWRPLALAAAVIALFVAARVLGLGGQLLAARAWIERLGPWGIAPFIALYVALTVMAFPGSVLTVAAGAIFGSVVGVAAVSAASTIGASLCFLISRYVARDAVAAWLGKRETFRRLDRLTESHGAMIVALTRLAPIFPFNLLNYGFGLTRVRFWTYVFWSWLCMLPGTVLYVVGADAAARAITTGRAPWLLIAVALGVLVALILIVRYARKKLRAADEGAGSAP